MKTRLLVPALAGILLTTTISFAQNAENQNPYAIFGRTPYVAGEKEDGVETAIFVIENFAQDAKVARIEHEPRTGRVRLLNRQGKLIKEKLLEAGENGWFTQDRFAEKYYSLSPYSFCAGNPIRFIDINGDSIWINHRGTDVLYDNGKLYNRDGSEYTGKVNNFMRKTISALGAISGTSTGASMVSELQSSENNFTIMKGDNHFKASDQNRAYGVQHQTENTATYQLLGATSFQGGSGGTIYWNPNGVSLPTTAGMRNDPFVVLGHEMFHGLDANRGTMTDVKYKGLDNNEWQAVYRENTMRLQAGIPLRTHYVVNATPEGVRIGGAGVRMITPANLPILPSWYRP